MSKVGSQQLGVLFYLYALHLKKGGITPVRGKIDLLHNIAAIISALLESEGKEMSSDYDEMETIFSDIEDLERGYEVDIEYQPWALEARQEFEIKIHKLFRAVTRISLMNELLDLSYLKVIQADMSQMERGK